MNVILFNGSKPVLSSFRNFISAIKDDKDGTTISHFETTFNDILNKYQNDAIPKAKNEVSNKCQDDPNESDCIKVARKEFNKYRKPVKLEGSDCIIYHSANKRSDRKYEQLTPRVADNTTGLSNFVSLQDAIKFDPKGGVYIINATTINTTKVPLKAIFDSWGQFGTGHVAIVPTIGTTVNIDFKLLSDWSHRDSYKLPTGGFINSPIHYLTGYVSDSVNSTYNIK